MKRVVFWGIWLAMLLLRVETLQGQSYTMTNGQTFTTCTGTFYDPGGPDENYDNNLHYTQTFKSASPYLCLKVTFTSFHLEDPSYYGNPYDYLRIYDGYSTSSPLIGTYYGTNSPGVIISSSGALTFVFHSDGSLTYSGWEATISCEECSLLPPTEPNYNMHHGTDIIHCQETPRHFYDPGGLGGSYDNNSDYTQTFVSSDPNSCLTVTFTSFATEWYFDKLYIYDGPVASGTILGVYSGYLEEFSVTSFTGALTFVFHSDSSSNDQGWEADISCSECTDPPEPSYNMHYGTDTIYCSQAPRPFYDPGGPDGDYDYLSDYIQTFVSSNPDGCLQVTFTSIDIDDWSGLYVYDGTSTSGTLLEVLTGIDSNVTIVSTTGALTFQFSTYFSAPGWEAVISCTECAVPPSPPPPPDPDPCDPNGIHPFCTDESYGITYSSGTSGENASSFLGDYSYSCLYITPNPAWYYMQVSEPGDLLIYIQQVSQSGYGLDVDFVCWGPFIADNQVAFVEKLCAGQYSLDDISHGSHRPTDGNHDNNMGGYPDGNVVDCSYSTQSTEWCFIPNAQAGEWYLLLITNYSGQLGSITFNLVDEYSTASTNCNLLVPFSYNEPVCEGDTLVLTCENPLPGATYNWSGPGGWTAVTTDPFVNIPNVSAGHSGQYELNITGIGDTTVQPFQLDVAIQAMPQVTVTVSADSVCEGNSVTLQANGAANYEWSPVPGTGGSITVTPDGTTTYMVVGTTGVCSDTAFGQVTVLQNTTGDTSAVVCDSFDWYEHVGLTNSDNYQHTFTNAEGCDSVVTLHLTVGGMSDVSISTPHNAICAGGSVELKAIPDDAVSYHWNTGETTSIITDTPNQTTEYSVTVTNSYGCKDSASVTIMVSENSMLTYYDSVCQGEAYDGYGFTLTAAETDTPGMLTRVHTETIGPGCVSTTTLWLTVYEHSDTTIDQTACDSLVWNGVTYYADTVLRDTLPNIHGCDSIVTVNLTVGSSPEVHITNPSPAAVCAGEEITLTAVTECWGLDTILYEGFDGLTGGNDSTTGSYGPGNTPLTFPLTDAFISGVKVYPAGDAIKLGNNSNTGSVTSNYLDLTQDFTVTIRAKGWIFNNNPKKTKIRVSTNPDNAQEFIVNGNSDFTDYSLAFSAAGANAQVMIETVNASGFDKRAFIDLVSITREVPCTYQWYTSTEVLGNDTVVTVTPPSTSWYYFTVPSPTGCERTDSVEVVVNSPVHTALSVIECDSYTWVDGDGVTHTENGDYLYPHEDANGCTQVDTLHLTIYHPAHQSYTVDTCGAYKWVGATNMTYTTSDDYTYKHKDEHGCWQVDTLHLTIHNPTHQSYTVDTCGAYMWEGGTGTTYTASGDYLYKHNDGNGCMQVDTLHLTIHNPTHTAITKTACESFTWNGTTYMESGEFTYSHVDANGCTQVDTLHLTIDNYASGIDIQSACGSYTWIDDNTYTQSNNTATYTIVGGAANGCDSVVTLHLTIYNPTHQSYTVDTCGAYMWVDGTGQTYTTSGDHTYVHQDANGCTQVDTLHLTIYPSLNQVYTEEICTSYTWIDGITYTTSGDRTYSHTNANGCTQVDTLHLTIKDTVLRHIYADVCLNNEYYDYGFLVTEEETTPSDTVIEKVNTGMTANGCDSVTVLHLTVKDTLLRHIYDTVCFNGGNYDSYGFELTEEEMSSTADTLLDHLDMGANECDSMTVLHLTVFHPAHQSFTETAYDNYTWTSGNGNTYVQSGTYTYEHCDENGCTQNDTLYLTVHYTSSNVFSKDTCDSYNWDGRILTETGTYYNADSTETLHLIIRHSTHNVLDTTACNSYVWHDSTYTVGGVHVYEYTNGEGCPSADTLYLTLVTTPDVIVSGPHIFCPDSSVTLTAITETAPESYLWSNGDTTSSITVSEASVYTVTAYYAGGCSAVSAGFHLFETENPIVHGYLNDMVAGDTQTVVIGTMADDNLQYVLPQSTLTYSTVTFLPDGVPCEPLGCSYKAEMSFSGFPDTAVVHSADEIRYIRLNMEHSAPIDLYIRLICPDGQQADILRKCITDSQSDCLSFIDDSHMGWPDGNVNQVYHVPSPYIKAWMGQVDIIPAHNDTAYRCFPAMNPPGTGWNYCWSDNTTEGYQYASANGCLVDTSNSIYYYNGGIQDLYHLSYIIMDSTDVAAGTQYYHPDESFDSLIGCHINGTWTIEVIDGISNDNGYIFECELGVAEHLSATHYAHVSEMFFDGMWTGAGGTDSTFVIMPPEDLANDTTVAYTFTLIDENGCTFDTVIHINVYAHKHIDLYDTVNSSQLPLVWEGLTFNGAGCQDTLLHTVHGADSLVTLHLSVIYHYDTAVCANIPLYWHNQTFYSTSSVTVSQSVESGCADSIEVLMVKVNPVFRDTLWNVRCANEPPFVWRGNSYSTTGTYYDSLVSVVTGCDSIYVLKLTVNPIFHRTVPVAVCDNELPFEWNGRYYDTTGMYLDTLAAVTGCDSIVMLALVVNPTYNQQEAATICDSELPYTWRDTVFQPGTATGSYVFHRETIHGCDSMVTLSLVVNPTYNQQEAATICDSELPYAWRDTVFQSGTATGSYVFHRETVHGCDSTVTLSLVVNPIYNQQEAATICDSELPYTWRDTVFQPGTGTGSYVFHRETIHGCDSTVTLWLVVNPTYDQQEAATICDSELPYTWRDMVFQLGTATGSFVFHRETVHGCDSTVTLSLVVNPTYDQQESATICDSELPYTWRDTVFQPGTETGSFVFHRETVNGCDSTVTLALTVNKVFQSIFDTVICANDIHFFWHNHQCDTTGVYYDSLVNPITLCDSIYVLSLTVSPSYNQYETQGICQSDLPYQWRDTLFLEGTETGDYVFHDTTAFGCDSIVTLHLMVSEIAFGNTLAIACDSFVWRGVTYFETPIENPTDTLYGGSTSGCDSVTVLHLTIHHSAVRFDTVSICESELPYTYGDTLFESGTLSGDFVFHDTTTYGCDSIVRLNLQVTQNIRTTQVPFIICEDHLPTIWNVPDTTHYIPLGTSGDTTIVDTFHFASNGCDSIVTRKLIIGTITDTTIVDAIVENQLPYWLNGKSYDSTGIYLDTTMNVAGCDSIITLDLTVFFNVRTPLDSIICNNKVPLIWNGLTFTETGMDSVVFVMDNGADSTVVMNVTVNDTSHNTITISELENNLPYILNGFEYDTTGIYTQHLTNAVGCDSTLTIDFTVLYNVRTELYHAECDGDILWPYEWNGVLFTGPGTDSITATAASGVDSTVVMTLVVNYPTAGTFADTVLENDLPSYQLNGFPYDSAGTYVQHLTNVNGCDSVLTFDLTVFFNDTITIDSTVCDNELGFYWNGVCFTEADTQSVVLNTSTGADSVVVMRVHVIESPDVTISGPPVFCADNFAQLTAVSATAFSYHWSTGDTTQSINANITGIYAVTVTNEYGCKDSDLMNLSEAVIVNPIASYQFPDLCAGNDYSITIGHQSVSTIVLDNPESTLSWADTVFLPDGKNCPPYGCSYQSPLTFTDFAPGSVVSSVNDILYVRLNMEHSYAGDLYIKLTCPNGQKADILKFKGHNGSTFNGECLSTIPLASRNWLSGNNAGGGTFFGMAYDHSSSGNDACNPNTNDNAPGIGWNYCWSNNNNQGYTYAPGQGSLVYRSVNAHTQTNAYYSFWNGENHYVDIFDSSNVAAGTRFYHPDQSFQNLVGCPLNGSWTIEVIDGLSEDNGYIFGWELALAPYLVPTPYSDVTFVWVEGPWVTTVSDTSFIFSPPDTLEHDTLVAYTFHLQDQYGCGYDTTVYLNVYAQSHTVIDTNVCASFDYNGVTYTQSETITWNGVNVHGCDSTCVINLTVYPMPTTAITGLPVPCVDDTAHLAAVCADPDALLVWSTGDTAQTITVTSSGDYTVTATNAKCSYDETVTVTFSSPNESTTDLTVCDSILWNGTVYTQTGSYVKTLTNAAGCDSVATLNLTVNYSYLNHDTLYLLQNQLPYYFAPHDTTFPYGSPSEFQFSYTLPAQNDCDSVIMEKVYVYMNYSHTFDTLVCASAVPLTWHGHTFTATGTATDLLFTVHGSDSLLIYTVTVDTVSATIGNVTHINCYGESNGAATATVTGGVSPLTYQWTNGAGASVSSATLLNNRPAGDYKFTVTDAAGCSATDSVTINLLHGQMLPGTITGLQSLCYGDMLGTVTGTAATGDDCTYQWQMSTDGTAWAPLPGTNNTQNYLFQTPATSSFQLRRAWISTGCGTLYSDTLDISVWPVSNDTIHDNVCVGIPYQNYGFDISASETSLPGTQIFEMRYSSQNGCDSSVTLVLAVNEPQETDFDVEICEGDGYYGNGFAILPMETIGTDTLLRILNLNTTDGCDSVVRLEVTVIDTMLRIVSPTADFCEDVSAELIVETNMPDYEWSTGEMTPNIIVTSPGVYSVTATQGGCSVTARYTVEPCEFQLYLPNAITPGRTDRLNDYFCIPEGSRNAINLFEISIVNRWGELVFYSTDKNFVWNGEYKGRIFHQTVYNYIIEYTDFAGRQFRVTGSITVL